jgi:IMP dehydrogenase
MEFRLLPGLTTDETLLHNISLRTPMVYSEDENSKYYLNIPIVAAAMQSVSGERMGIELAKLGCTAFIYCSQPVEQQAEMIRKIKRYKAGFVPPETVNPEMLIRELYELTRQRGYNTFPVVNAENKLLGIITKNDYDVKPHGDLPVKERMIPRSKLTVGVNIDNIKAICLNNVIFCSFSY